MAEDNGVFVAKEFYQTEDGRKFIIESVGWEEIQPMLKDLAGAKAGEPSARGEPQLADARTWPNRVAALTKQEPLQVAALPYRSDGFLVDLDLSGFVSTYTFLSGTTYYIPQSFYISGTATTTFQPGCVIKYGSDAWLLLHCPFSFPPSGQMMPVLTSKDDDLFGAMIPGSTHNPTKMARQALLVYYVIEYVTEIKNVWIRWANKGIEYDAYTGNGVNHTVRDSLFQQCQTGIYASVPDGSVTLVNVKKCNVTTPITCNCDGQSGSMADDCGPLYTTANFLGIQSGEVIDGQSVLNPPDTMGAIGPNHFIELLNGAIVIFDRWTGQRIGQMGIDNFFRYTVGGTTYPRAPAHMVDPRIIYDHRSGRWFASAMENRIPPGNQVLLAVSKGSDPIGNPSSDWKNLKWDRVLIDLKDGSSYIDRPTLGVDDNGVYICANAQSCGLVNIAAIQKGPLLAVPTTLNATYFKCIPGATWVQPAVNFDPVPPGGAAWFVAHRPGQNQDIVYATITWSAGVPSLSPWTILSTPAFGGDILIPSKGSPNS